MKFSLALQVLRAEGLAAFRDRLADRVAVRRRRRSFRPLASDARSTDPATLSALAEVPVLNVLSTPPRPDLGGVQVQLLRRLAAEGRRRSWALLYPDGGGYRLEISSPAGRSVVTLQAAVPSPDQLVDPNFEWAVLAAAARVGAGTVHFEQLVGWPLASVANLQARLQLVLSVHDFGLFCLRPHLLERPMLRFCDYSRDATRCTRCLRCDWPVADDFQQHRRRRAAALMQSAAAVIYPSDFLRRTYQELVPGLDSAGQDVVEPPTLGTGSPLPGRQRSNRKGSGLAHIAYVGSVKAHKGALLFEEVVRKFQDSNLRWTVYGGGDEEILQRLRQLPSVRVRGYYRADKLPEMLRRDGVDLAVLLSTWPEAYALTFDECLRAGVPALAFDHGAIGDRMRRCGGGALVPLDAGIEGVGQVLHELLEEQKGTSETVLTPAANELALPDGHSAAEAMLAIYDRLGVPVDNSSK